MPGPAHATTPPAPGRSLFTALFIDAVGSGLWLPFNLIFFTQAQQVALGPAGVALTAGALVGLVVGQLSGGVLDRVGPYAALVVSNLARALVFSLYPVVHHPWQVAVVAAAVSAGDRVYWTASYPYLASRTSGRDVDRLFGTVSVLQLIGLGLGAAAAGLFATNTDALHLLAWLNAASFLASGLLFLTQPRIPRTQQSADADTARPATVWRDRPYLQLCGAHILLVVMTSSYVVILPLAILREFHGPTWLVGASVITANAVLAATQKPVIRYARSRPRRTLILASLPVFAVSFVVLTPLNGHTGITEVVILVLVASCLGGLAESMSTTLMISAANQAAPAGSQGRYSAAFQTSWGLAEVIAPLLFTRLLLAGNAALWLTLVAVAGLVAPVLTSASRRLPPSVLTLPDGTE